jgi:hypothetical protein
MDLNLDRKVVNNFGEFIEVKTTLAQASNYVALVHKYVDGAHRVSYCAKSLGEAKKITSNIIRYNQA